MSLILAYLFLFPIICYALLMLDCWIEGVISLGDIVGGAFLSATPIANILLFMYVVCSKLDDSIVWRRK